MSTEVLENVIKSVGGMEELKRKREQFRQNLEFIDNNRDELLEHYSENWVAVHKSDVIAHGKDYNHILSELQGHNMPVDEIPIRYLSKHKFFALYLY